MKEKLWKLREALDYLKDAVDTLEHWNDKYDENLFIEINGLFYILNGLECYQDYLIEGRGEKL